MNTESAIIELKERKDKAVLGGGQEKINSYLPQNNMSEPLIFPCKDPINREDKNLNTIIPEKKQEYEGIITHGAKLLYAYAKATDRRLQ